MKVSTFFENIEFIQYYCTIIIFSIYEFFVPSRFFKNDLLKFYRSTLCLISQYCINGIEQLNLRPNFTWITFIMFKEITEWQIVYYELIFSISVISHWKFKIRVDEIPFWSYSKQHYNLTLIVKGRAYSSFFLYFE